MKSYRVVLWVLALAGLAGDQAAKYGVFAGLAPVEAHRHWLFQSGPQTGFALETRYEYGPDGGLTPGVNQGALFGLGREHATFANWTFAVVSLLAAGAITYWSFRPSASRDLWVCMALGLILAGTLGNLYDRVVFNGVRDFLHWNYLFDWPVFNIADSCLVCGAGLLLLQAFGRRSTAAKTPHSADGPMAARPKAAAAKHTSAACVAATPTAKG
jgi:lipoprotein signal peptidase